MLVSDLIEELRKYPDLSTVFIQSNDGDIRRIDSVHDFWTHDEPGSTKIVPATDDANEFGPLLYG